MRLLTICCLLSLSACKKENWADVKPNNGLFGPQCVIKTPVSKSNYQRLVFSDNFAGGAGPCFTQKPTCNLRLDWSEKGACPFDESKSQYAGIANLDKCTWTIFQSYDFWASNALFTYDASAIEVSGGTLKLKILPNPNFAPVGRNCGAVDDTNPDPGQYYGTNCRLLAGGLDSNYFNAQTPGRDALYGRIEMTARYTQTTSNGGYPAFWMWPVGMGKGYPTLVTAEANPIVEMDILEFNSATSNDYLFQSIHDYVKGQDGTISTGTVRVDKTSDYHTYGVEWSPGDVKYYIDDCYTTEVTTGSPSNQGPAGTMSMSQTASFMMLNVGGSGGNPVDYTNHDVYEIQSVKIYQ